MAVIKSKQATRFTQVSNVILSDARLSWKAKGLYAYLYSKPANFEFAGDRITKDATDGRKSTYTALNELINRGYVKREKNPNGRIDYHLFVQLTVTGNRDKKPNALSGKEPKRQRAEKGNISNTDSSNNTDISNKKESKPRPIDTIEVEEYFKEIGLNGKAKIESEKFFDHFSANGWKVGGKSLMKDWKAAARNWNRRVSDFTSSNTEAITSYTTPK